MTDVPGKFVADPFLVEENLTWYLFFEVYNLKTEQGDLAVATSTNTKNWRYEQIVLDELSIYPILMFSNGKTTTTLSGKL